MELLKTGKAGIEIYRANMKNPIEIFKFVSEIKKDSVNKNIYINRIDYREFILRVHTLGLTDIIRSDISYFVDKYRINFMESSCIEGGEVGVI